MSIHHSVSIHCDTCGTWHWGADMTTEQRRQAGWKIWQNALKHWRHKCPSCVEDGRA